MGYTSFPHAAQVLCIERRTSDLDGSNERSELSYAVTSLPVRGTEQENAERLLALSRGHWTIENRIHWVRDVTYDEDRSQTCKGASPRTLATLRNLAISLLRLAGADNIAAGLRECCRSSAKALRLIGFQASPVAA